MVNVMRKIRNSYRVAADAVLAGGGGPAALVLVLAAVLPGPALRAGAAVAARQLGAGPPVLAGAVHCALRRVRLAVVALPAGRAVTAVTRAGVLAGPPVLAGGGRAPVHLGAGGGGVPGEAGRTAADPGLAGRPGPALNTKARVVLKRSLAARPRPARAAGAAGGGARRVDTGSPVGAVGRVRQAGVGRPRHPRPGDPARCGPLQPLSAGAPSEARDAGAEEAARLVEAGAAVAALPLRAAVVLYLAVGAAVAGAGAVAAVLGPRLTVRAVAGVQARRLAAAGGHRAAVRAGGAGRADALGGRPGGEGVAQAAPAVCRADLGHRLHPRHRRPVVACGRAVQ